MGKVAIPNLPSIAERVMVRTWMSNNKLDYLEAGTSEINATGLAEAAADEFEIYIEDDGIPEWVFELSFSVSEEEP